MQNGDNYKFWDAWPNTPDEVTRIAQRAVIKEMNIKGKNKKQEIYTDFERGPYQESKKSKITRVMRLYGLFSELSRVEKDNFINLLQNSKHINNYL